MNIETLRSLNLKKILAPVALAGVLGIPALACGVTAWANDMKLSVEGPPNFTKNSLGNYYWGDYQFSTRFGANRVEISAGVGDFAVFSVQTHHLTDLNRGSLFILDLNLGNNCGGVTYISEEGIQNPLPGGFCFK